MYDPDATGHLHVKHLADVIRLLPPPLGLDPSNYRNRMILSSHIARYVYQVPQSDDPLITHRAIRLPGRDVDQSRPVISVMTALYEPFVPYPLFLPRLLAVNSRCVASIEGAHVYQTLPTSYYPRRLPVTIRNGCPLHLAIRPTDGSAHPPRARRAARSLL